MSWSKFSRDIQAISKEVNRGLQVSKIIKSDKFYDSDIRLKRFNNLKHKYNFTEKQEKHVKENILKL